MPDDDLQRLARDLHMLAALTRRVLESDLDAGRSGLSFPQLVILRWLAAAGKRRARDVAQFLSASAPAATQMLARLKRKGLVRSRTNRTDRRAGDLALTPAAHALLRRHAAGERRRLRRVLGGLTGPARRRLAGVLESAIEALLSDRPRVEDLCLHCGAHASPTCVARRFGYRCPTDGGCPPRPAGRPR